MEMQWSAQYRAYVEDTSGDVAYPERPEPQSDRSRMQRRAWFVAVVAGVPRLCPTKDNKDAGAVVPHADFASLQIVSNANK
jgi:hypothetical protein